MRWSPGGSKRNIEDRRGQRGVGMKGIGAGGGLILLVLSLIFGGDIFSGAGPVSTDMGAGVEQGPIEETAAERENVEFVTFVLNDAQEVWTRVLPRYGTQYREAQLVLFRDAVDSACGTAPAAAGPFYCPLDEKMYIDLSFFDELHTRFGAPGDFAQAYVIAHEIGHHVQHILGTNQRVRQLQEANPREANDLSVRLELQADCFAGVWGNSTEQRRLLDPGDVEEGLAAAAAIGDDRLQGQSGGRVNPESFTHGTSAQRVTWFRRGFESGSPEACDTFNTR